MKNILVRLFVTFILVAGSLVARKNDPGTIEPVRYLPGVVVVKMKHEVHRAGRSTIDAQQFSLQSKYRLGAAQRTFRTDGLTKKEGIEELERIYTFPVPATTDIVALAQSMMSDPAVEWAEPDYIFRSHVIPNDPNYAQVYPLSIVKADTAWGIHKGDTSVVIAIIDSGVDWDHPDLASVIWTNWDENPTNGIDDDGNGFVDDSRGWDFVTGVTTAAAGEDANTPDNNPMDFNGHGTHCAGIAAGATNNAIGIASLGWGCRVMPLRIGWHDADGNGYGVSTWMSQAFIYAANNGASVASLSYGTGEASVEGARYAFKNGVVVVNSAGNSNSDFAGLLGTHPWAISVAATNSNDAKASYSSFNSFVDVSAPGGDFSSGNFQGFLSTVVNPSSLYGGKLYEYFHGTSMATPLVAALAGVVKSQNKTLTPAQILFRILGTADNIEGKLAAAHKGKMGSGRINALRALTETPAMPGPKLQLAEYSINDSAGGNGNGVLEPGEQAKVIVKVRNEWGDATSVTAALATTHWTTTVTKSASSYGTVPGISDLSQWEKTNAADAFTITIGANAVPSVVPMTVTFTAAGGYQKQFAIALPIAPSILLVDDDDGLVNVEEFYTSTLQTLGVSFDVWNRLQKGTPSASTMSKYSMVVWFCEWSFPGLDSVDRAALTTYLNGGGKLFISGQDLGWDLADPAGTEYVASSGASKTFFENMLKSKFISDDAGSSSMIGTANDSIGKGLSFSRYQVNRASTEQYPEVIEPFGGSVSSFNYGSGAHTGKSGAIRYNGAYKLVYFGFGGIEAIVESASRLAVFDRVLKWLGGYDAVVDNIADTENTTNPITVNSVITSGSPIQSVTLYYDTDGSMPFNSVPMTLSNGKYSANIPAQTANSTVQYFVLTKTSTGYLPYTTKSFFVGPDVVKPQFVTVDDVQNSILFSGPFPVSLSVTDNIGIDSTKVIVHYSVNGGTAQTASLSKTGGNSYGGNIIPGAALNSGDVVTYHITAADVAAVPNTAQYPPTGTKSFVIGRQFVDTFEKVDSARWNFDGWGYSSNIKRGLFSITDSPTGNYGPNNNRSLVLSSGVDLTPYSKVTLQYYRRLAMHSSDTVFVEVSRNNTDWTTFRKLTGIGFAMTAESFSIDQFAGAGNSSVKVRFRLKTDGANEADGIYIDDVELLVNSFALPVQKNSDALPAHFSLAQNYPNPFNPTTNITFAVPDGGRVTVKVFDAIGKEVATLVDTRLDAGYYSVPFDAQRLSSGVYYYTMTSGSFRSMKKMLFLK